MQIKRYLRFIFLILTGLLGFKPIAAQHYKNIVFEGGAIQGIAHFGAIKVLDSAGILDSVQNVAGTSSGAIQAMMLSLGYTTSEMEEILKQTKWETFNDGAYAQMTGSMHLLQNLSWLPGSTLHTWLESLVFRKTGIYNATFKQVDSLMKLGKPMKNLKVVATNLSRLKAVELSLLTYPNMSISDAVYGSSAIPFYYKPLIIDKNGHVLKEANDAYFSEYLVDGGLMANVPNFLFDSSQYNTLYVVLDVPQDLQPSGSANKLNFIEFTELCYYAAMEGQSGNDQNSMMQSHTIHIGVGNLSPRIRKMQVNEIAILIGNGEKAAREFLAK